MLGETWLVFHWPIASQWPCTTQLQITNIKIEGWQTDIEMNLNLSNQSLVEWCRMDLKSQATHCNHNHYHYSKDSMHYILNYV